MGRVVDATPRPFYLRERHGTDSIGEWVGSRAGLDRCGKSRPTGIQSPERPARSESLYRLSYPGLPKSGVTYSDQCGWRVCTNINRHLTFPLYNTKYGRCKNLVRMAVNWKFRNREYKNLRHKVVKKEREIWKHEESKRDRDMARKIWVWISCACLFCVKYATCLVHLIRFFFTALLIYLVKPAN
jgi:hypothetical protein